MAAPTPGPDPPAAHLRDERGRRRPGLRHVQRRRARRSRRGTRDEPGDRQLTVGGADPGRGRGRAAGHRRGRRRWSGPSCASTNRPVLRGVPARPRLHRAAGHHLADLRICPVAYQTSAVQRDRAGLRRELDPRRWLSCAGCCTAGSGSPATPCTSTCCTRPTSSATRTRSRSRDDHRDVVERGLALKKAGNAMMELVGGRAIHPVNLAVGRLLPGPTAADLAPLAEQLRARLDLALNTVELGGRVRLPRPGTHHDLLALHDPDGYAIETARSSRSGGLAFPAASSATTSSRSRCRTPPRCTPRSTAAAT